MIATHGHLLFDPGWNLVTDYPPETIKALYPSKINLASLELLDSPVTEFWNDALAQMGRYNFIFQTRAWIPLGFRLMYP